MGPDLHGFTQHECIIICPRVAPGVCLGVRIIVLAHVAFFFFFFFLATHAYASIGGLVSGVATRVRIN